MSSFILRTTAVAVVAGSLWSGAIGLADEKGAPWRYSEAWWRTRALDPPGARQVEHKGKNWPPFPRPTGPHQTMHHQYHHAHYWPYPYVCDDRAAVRDAMANQISAGWMNATMLEDHHFNLETQELNSVGRAHLFWIATHVPQQHRAVYVAQTVSPAIDQTRIAEVQRQMTEWNTQSIPVSLRSEQTALRPAVEIDAIRRLDLQSQPRPKLKLGVGAQSQGSSSSTTTTTGGAGAAGGGGASGGSGAGGSSTR